MNFDFDDIEAVTFGVGVRRDDNPSFRDVPVDRPFEATLREVSSSTWIRMNEISPAPHPYDPANFAGGSQHLFVDIDDPTAEVFKVFLQEDQLPPGGTILRDPTRVFCYFARLVDSQGNRLIGIRRSSTFKGLAKQRNRVARLIDDTLHLEPDNMFRLDSEFDVLVASDEVRIFHPKGFESLAQLREVIREAVPRNVEAARQHLNFVDFGVIEEAATRDLRIARVLASVLATGISGVTLDSLRQYCEETNVDINVANDRIIIEEDQVVDFLDALSRRLLTATLVPGEREVYRAPVRHRVSAQ